MFQDRNDSFDTIGRSREISQITMTRATRSVFYIEIFHDRRRLIPLVITGIRWRGTRSIQEKKKRRKKKKKNEVEEKSGACVACQSRVFTTPRIQKGRLGEIRGFDSIKNQSPRRSIKSTKHEEGAARCSFPSRASSGSSAFLSDGARLVEHKRPFA